MERWASEAPDAWYKAGTGLRTSRTPYGSEKHHKAHCAFAPRRGKTGATSAQNTGGTKSNVEFTA